MGAFRFDRKPEVLGGKNMIQFDSSAELAIGRAFGWDKDTVVLTETARTEKMITYDVSAAEFTPEGTKPKPVLYRGVLRCLTRDEAWRHQTQSSAQYEDAWR